LVVPKRAEPERFVAEPAAGDQLVLGFDDGPGLVRAPKARARVG
jgi:hypothetical protein